MATKTKRKTATKVTLERGGCRGVVAPLRKGKFTHPSLKFGLTLSEGGESFATSAFETKGAALGALRRKVLACARGAKLNSWTTDKLGLPREVYDPRKGGARPRTGGYFRSVQGRLAANRRHKAKKAR